MPFGARTAKILLVTPVAVYVALSVLYLFVPRYFDWVEPGILSTAWAFVQGEALYQSVDSGIQHNYPYGPYLFIFHGFSLWLLSPTLFSGKLAGALFANFAFAALYITVRRMGGGRTVAWVAPAAHAYFLFLIWPFDTYTARADSFVMGLVATSALAMTIPSSALAALAFGAAAGITVNIKINAAIYFLPVLGIFWRRIGLKFLVVSGSGFLVFLVLPFLLTSIDINNYIVEIGMQAKLGFASWIVAVKRLADIFGLYLLPAFLPAFLLRAGIRESVRASAPFFLTIGFTFAICLVIASKVGSTRTQFAPAGLTLALWLGLYLCGIIRDRGTQVFSTIPRRRGIFAWILYTLVFLSVPATIPRAFDLVKQGRENARAIEEIRTVQSRDTGRTIAVGNGENWNDLSWNRAVLVFDGNPNFADMAGLATLVGTGHRTPSKLLAKLEQCEVGTYLIPMGEGPFAQKLNGLYLFDMEFRSTFRRRYQLISEDQGRYYDQWRCVQPEGG